ncbi:nucleoside monophosphate kinase, partial [Candidatus Roizmanbacteria bacterium]|nr:nucleoside monophosphate kinase [Candidatus Roizmanbacteria bacterium]
MKIILIGIQGAGKSTQGNLLSQQLQFPYLSTGHIFRELAKEKTTLGRYIKETLNAGFLIPDEKTIEIVESYLRRPEY